MIMLRRSGAVALTRTRDGYRDGHGPVTVTVFNLRPVTRKSLAQRFESVAPDSVEAWAESAAA